VVDRSEEGTKAPSSEAGGRRGGGGGYKGEGKREEKGAAS
jgi:hypothetical protein